MALWCANSRAYNARARVTWPHFTALYLGEAAPRSGGERCAQVASAVRPASELLDVLWTVAQCCRLLSIAGTEQIFEGFAVKIFGCGDLNDLRAEGRTACQSADHAAQ